jgi:hypothetical protein
MMKPTNEQPMGMPLPQNTMHSKRKVVELVIATVLVVAAVIAGIYWYIKKITAYKGVQPIHITEVQLQAAQQQFAAHQSPVLTQKQATAAKAQFAAHQSPVLTPQEIAAAKSQFSSVPNIVVDKTK